MNRIFAKLAILITVAVLCAACGSAGPQTAGPLTVPSTDTTAAPVPDTEPPSTDTTVPSSPTTEPTPPTTAPTDSPGSEVSTSTITVYFLDPAGSAIPVQRSVTTTEVARAALEALIAGPNEGELAAGLSTSVPEDTLILGIRIEDGTATVDFSREVEAGGGSSAILGRLAQVVYSLTEFPTVERVQILLEGQRVPYFSGEGVLIEEPLVRADFTGSVPVGDELTDGTASVWEQGDLPVVTIGAADVYRVVLVAGNDVLNVRDTPGVDGTIVGKLEPGVAVRVGETQAVGDSTWRTVETPVGPGWVNAFYLTPSVAEGQLPAARDVVHDFADRLAGNASDLADAVSERGLWVAHHATPIRFRPEQLDGILDDPTTYRWGSNALGPDSPEIQPETFAQAIADRFVGAYFDADVRILPHELVEGPNGRPPQFAIPPEFQGFPYVTVFDPADDPQYGGLDWTGWIVSLALEDGHLKVVGLTIDEWAP